MASRMILGAVISLALVLSPGAAQSVPIKGIKKSSSVKTKRKRPERSQKSALLVRVIPRRDGCFVLQLLGSENPAIYCPMGESGSKGLAFPDLVLAQANHYCGARYRRGASLANSSATDCSGFVQYIYKGFKIDLPRSSAEQAQVGKVVTRDMDFSKLLPGDLLFFRRGGHHIGHAGIYLGGGKMIHASNHRYGVIITNLRQPYYEDTFVVAKRVFEVQYQ